MYQSVLQKTRLLILALLLSILCATTFIPSQTAQADANDVSVTYTVAAQWIPGFTAAIVITNNGTTPINGWTLEFDFPAGQTITSSFNAICSQNGAHVTATNAVYNKVLLPGRSFTIGFTGRWSGSNPVPTSFVFNGVTIP